MWSKSKIHWNVNKIHVEEVASWNSPIANGHLFHMRLARYMQQSEKPLDPTRKV